MQLPGWLRARNLLWNIYFCEGRKPSQKQKRGYRVGNAFLASLSGSFLTSHISSRIMVSPFAEVYFGHVGSPPPLVSPVFMNCSKEWAILVDSFLGLAPPPLWLNIRSVL